MYLIRLYGSRTIIKQNLPLPCDRAFSSHQRSTKQVILRILGSFASMYPKILLCFFRSFSECRKRTTIRFEIGTNCDSTLSTLGTCKHVRSLTGILSIASVSHERVCCSMRAENSLCCVSRHCRLQHLACIGCVHSAESPVTYQSTPSQYLLLFIVKTVLETTCLRDRQKLCQHVVETGNMLPYSIMDRNVTFICSFR